VSDALVLGLGRAERGLISRLLPIVKCRGDGGAAAGEQRIGVCGCDEESVGPAVFGGGGVIRWEGYPFGRLTVPSR
jgi:hypothetical protein